LYFIVIKIKDSIITKKLTSLDKLNKITIFICLSLAIAIGAKAQTSNAQILKKVKLNLLEKVEQYSLLSGVSNDDEKDEFFRLFKSDTVLINNDIMPDNNLMQKLTIKEYADLIPNYFTASLRISTRPYNIGINNTIDSSSGEFWVDAKKYISGVSKKGIYYNDSTFDIRFTFNVNYYKEQYEITDITLNKERGRYLVITTYKKVH